MELYATSEELFRLESIYPSLKDNERIYALLTITWHIRQRDCQRALFQIDEIEQLLQHQNERKQKRIQNDYEIRARLNLIRAEIHALLGDRNYAELLLKQGKFEFSKHNDIGGLGDSAIVEATVATSIGDTRREIEACTQALDLFRKCGDFERMEFVEAWLCYALAFSEPELARSSIERFQAKSQFSKKPSITAHICAAEGVILGRRDPGKGARAYLRAANFAKQTGLTRLAIVSAGNACEVFQNIGDIESATQAIEFALELAKQAGWPSLMGFCYAHLGRAQREVGQLDLSEHTLHEALHFFPPNSSGINKAIALRELGETYLNGQNIDRALEAFKESISIFRCEGSMDDLPHTLIRFARALSASGQIKEALESIDEARQLCDHYNFAAIKVSLFQVLAEIYNQHHIQPPLNIAEPNAIIHFLEKALQAGASIEGWHASARLCTMLSDAWAEAGELVHALNYSRKALAAEQTENALRIAYKTAHIQDHHQTEKAQAEAQYHHLIAIAESNRARALQDTKDTLVKLSKIGQEITAKLESTDAFISIHENLSSLLDANSFRTYLLSTSQKELTLVYGVQNNHHITPHEIPLSEENCIIVKCARERRDLNRVRLLDETGEQTSDYLTDRSQLVAPLIVAERLLGVMVIGSQDENAYSDREQLIFTTISAYAAIALDNSSAYHELRLTQHELLQAIQKLEIARKKEQSDREKAEEATKLKSEFLANMSHEIRTPMNAVIGMAYLALLTELSPKQRDYIKKIQLAASSLLGIINDILDFSKIEAGKLEVELTPFALEDVVSQISNITAHKATDKGLNLSVEIETNLPSHFVGDPMRIGQVLTNLVNNAIKFTATGEIRVRCRSLPQAATNAKSRLIEFSVTDTGIGMTEEQKQRLFKPFTQGDGSTTRNYGGTGLGLSICKQLIELMGGKIYMESEYGKGSCFHFEVPLPVYQANSDTANKIDEISLATISSSNFSYASSSPKDPQMTSAPSQHFVGNNQKARILLAEDNEFNQEIAVELLTQFGFDITVAQHGQDAIDILARHDAHHFDLILMDLEMPVLDGHNATIQIRSMPDFDHLPIIALTAHAMKGTRDRCVEEGMQDYLTKPFNPDELFRTIQHWLQASINEPKLDALNVPPPTPDVDSLHVESIDIQRGLGSVANNLNLYLKLLDKFRSSHHVLLANSNYLTVEGIGTPEFRREVHTLKGQTATLGANAIAQLCVELESILENQISDFQGLQKAARLCEEIRTSMHELLLELDSYFQRHPLGEITNTGSSLPGTFKDSVATIRKLLEAANVDAVDFFQAHEKQFEQELGRTSFAQLHHAIDQYDFDRALQILNA